MTETTDWSPTAVGELFVLVMPNGFKMLMRVTELSAGGNFKSEQGSIDDALEAPADVPHFHVPVKVEL